MAVIENGEPYLLNKPAFVKPDTGLIKSSPTPPSPWGNKPLAKENHFRNLKNKPFKQISLTKALVQDHIFNLSYID
jgi:hypothetical protein